MSNGIPQESINGDFTTAFSLHTESGLVLILTPPPSDSVTNSLITNFVSGDVTVIDSNDMVVDTIDVGNLFEIPFVLEYSPATGNIYVANTFSDNITIIPS